MRGKVAKQLRRTAEKLTVGQSPILYGRHKKTGAIWLKKNCTRSLYQKFKTKYKEVRRSCQA